ncbi:MAG: hypothetical protein RL617_748, partial [Pseudomonadota bacterium]
PYTEQCVKPRRTGRCSLHSARACKVLDPRPFLIRPRHGGDAEGPYLDLGSRGR